jgi:hypothetical protein
MLMVVCSAVPTFYRMSGPPGLTLEYFLCFLMLTLYLLDSLIMIIDGRAEDLLGSLLAYYKLVQMLFEGAWSDLRGANVRGFP